MTSRRSSLIESQTLPSLASSSTSASISFLFSNPDWRFYLHNGTLKTVCFSALTSSFTSASISFLFSNPDWRFYLHNGTLKTIYIAPFKAPVQEKLQDWSNKLGSIGIKCLEMKTKKTNLAFSLE